MAGPNKRYRSSAAEMADEKRRVEKLLLEDLHRGDKEVGARLPGERKLAARYGASLRVIRGVLEKLQAQNLVKTAPRSGAEICRSPYPLAGKKFAFVTFMELSNPQFQSNDNTGICSWLESRLATEGATLDLVNFWHPGWTGPMPALPKSSFVKYSAKQVTRQLREGNYDGILYSEGDGNCFEVPDFPPGAPVIGFSSYVTRTDRHTVGFDDVQCGETAARHLLEFGHRRTAIVYIPATGWGNQRRDGARQVFAEHPDAALLEYPLEIFENPLSDFSELERVAAAFLTAGVTAVIAPNDRYASYLLKILQKNGKSVPEDCALVGFDDIGSLRPCNMTTVQRSYLPIAQSVLEILQDLFAHPETREKIRKVRLACPLMIRSTSRKIPNSKEEK